MTINATAAYNPNALDDNETLATIVSKHKHTEETTLGTSPIIWVRLWNAIKDENVTLDYFALKSIFLTMITQFHKVTLKTHTWR